VQIAPGDVLVGNARASEIVINVLFPFAYSWYGSSEQVSGKILELYRLHPKISYNSIERHMMAQLGLRARQVDSACKQQGLLHIYKTRCTQGGCGGCVLGDLKSQR